MNLHCKKYHNFCSWFGQERFGILQFRMVYMLLGRYLNLDIALLSIVHRRIVLVGLEIYQIYMVYKMLSQYLNLDIGPSRTLCIYFDQLRLDKIQVDNRCKLLVDYVRLVTTKTKKENLRAMNVPRLALPF
jgi:hypothetical protein